MKVAFSISPLISGHRDRGVGKYTLNLLKQLKNFPKQDVEIVEFSGDVPAQCDLVHYPFFDPFFLTLPLFKNKPVIVTVHDLIPILFPGHFPRGLKGSAKWQIQKLSLKKCGRILTDSSSSAMDIQRELGISKEKISVVHLAADNTYRVIATSALARISEKYAVNKNYLIYTGDINWNKNILGLIKAFALYRKNNPLSRVNKLLLAGAAFLKQDLTEAKEIRSLVKDLELERDVHFLGRVPTEELAALYNLAYFYIQPSFYEGFGLPLLEAMACGCPALSSNTSSLPEVGGDAALYFDPSDTQDILAKMEEAVFLTPEMYKKQQNQSLERSRKFTWEKTAQQTIEAYEKILT